MNSPCTDKLTMTVPEAARTLGISRGLAYEMARTGKLPTLCFGKRIVVPKKAIENMLESQANQNPKM